MQGEDKNYLKSEKENKLAEYGCLLNLKKY